MITRDLIRQRQEGQSLREKMKGQKSKSGCLLPALEVEEEATSQGMASPLSLQEEPALPTP